MNEMFSQGGKGSTGILTNKQAIARKFGVKQSEVLYAKPGAVLTGYKVVYDKVSQRSYALPSNLPAGATITSLTDGILVHNTGTVDLGGSCSTSEGICNFGRKLRFGVHDTCKK